MAWCFSTRPSAATILTQCLFYHIIWTNGYPSGESTWNLKCENIHQCQQMKLIPLRAAPLTSPPKPTCCYWSSPPHTGMASVQVNNIRFITVQWGLIKPWFSAKETKLKQQERNQISIALKWGSTYPTAQWPKANITVSWGCRFWQKFLINSTKKCINI